MIGCILTVSNLGYTINQKIKTHLLDMGRWVKMEDCVCYIIYHKQIFRIVSIQCDTYLLFFVSQNNWYLFHPVGN